MWGGGVAHVLYGTGIICGETIYIVHVFNPNLTIIIAFDIHLTRMMKGIVFLYVA